MGSPERKYNQNLEGKCPIQAVQPRIQAKYSICIFGMVLMGRVATNDREKEELRLPKCSSLELQIGRQLSFL